jgi:hypothetical protein
MVLIVRCKHINQATECLLCQSTRAGQHHEACQALPVSHEFETVTTAITTQGEVRRLLSAC